MAACLEIGCRRWSILMMMVGCGLLTALIVALGAALGWSVRRNQRPPLPPEQRGRTRALHILEERYARGEITEEEFEERRRALLGE